MTQPLLQSPWHRLILPLPVLLMAASCNSRNDDAAVVGGIGPASGGQGRYASYLDLDQSGSVNAGDALLLRFNQTLDLGPGADAAFQLGVNGDGLGTDAQVTLESNRSVVRITLGAGASLRTRGAHAGSFDANEPSGVRISPNSPAGAVVGSGNQLDAQRGGLSIDISPSFSPGASGDAASHVLSVDMDCDGLSDLVWVATGQYGGVRVQLQQDGAGFVDATALFLEGILELRAADLDLDGRPDLVLLLEDESVRVLHNQGLTGEVNLFDAASFVTNGLGVPQALEITDFNGDGDADLVVGTDQGLLVAMGQEQLNFEDLSVLEAPLASYSCLVAADFNQDGRMDLVACSDQGDHVLLYGQDGSLLETVTRAGSELTRDLAVGDIDSDGRLDLVLATDGALLIWRQDPLAGFLPDGQEGLLAADDTRAVRLADIDQDSKLDLVLLDSSSLELRVGDGLGSFSRSPLRSLLSAATGTDMALGDLDHDGDLDIFSAAEESQLWWGSATGSFGTGTYTELTVLNPSSMVFPGVGPTYDIQHADFDGDGDLDAASAANGSIYLWRNLGAGFMELSQVLSIGGDRAHKLVFADFNLDGLMDLAAAATGKSNHLWLAESAGVYGQTSTPILAGAQGTFIRRDNARSYVNL